MGDSPQQTSDPEKPNRYQQTKAWLAVLWPRARPLLGLAVFFTAVWLLHHEFKSIKWSDVSSDFRALPWWSVLAALGLTVANFAVLIGYDWLGVRLVQHPLSGKQIVTASLLSYAFSNSLGTFLGGTPIRFRLYSSWGLTVSEIVRLSLFIGFAFWIGLCSLAGVLFVATPFDIPARFNLPIADSRPLGVAMLCLAATFYVACVLRRRPLQFLKVNIQPPPLRIALAQTVVAAVDFMLAAGVLYVLLPADIPVSYFQFVAVFLLAIIISLASHIPGGLGVLELVLITMLPHSSTQSLVACLLAFRIIYYFIPLMLAMLAIGIATAIEHRQRIAGVAKLGTAWTRLIGPHIVTGAVFVAGLVLLVSGALPSAGGRMELIRRAMPLPVIEFSHFLGSIIGALLIILARALQRRIDAAWGLTLGLLGLGIIVSLSKGLDFEEASVLGLLLLALLPCRSHFYRRGRLLAPTLSVAWAVAMLLAVGLTIWLTLFAYRHVEYSDDLWWRFAYRGDAPRSLRALVGVIVTLVLVATFQLLRPRRSKPPLPSEAELTEVATIVDASQMSNANLALLGDKRFIFSADRRAFVMFGCEGQSWITMGDPIGPRDSADEAAWQFREECDAAGVYPVFYQVDENALSRYIEMGLSMLKIGECARVPLTSFTLVGSSRKDLRRTTKKSAEVGLSFKIVPRSDVPALLPTLKRISDAWLQGKGVGEKGFSLGFFNESYLRRYDMALVVLKGEPIAFANLWKSADRHELSIDLMRYLPDAPPSAMEFLFIQLMLWGKDEGFQWFDLGMAPLSGVGSHRLGPLWNRAGSLMFRHGEHFYNFQGLRSYKNKFDPVWSPKYVASPGGLATPTILANVSALIAGGLIKLVKR